MGQTFGYAEGDLPVTEEVSACLLRLPLYFDITPEEQYRVVQEVAAFLEPRRVPVGAAVPLIGVPSYLEHAEAVVLQ